ncbi:sugar-binding transcriptional regulator [Lactobacillus sp. ESL0791]|uniref:sugar-binding transcriptional regulator n=1 Tax=Lactobacillus sp. ESL0791 TaxID=2983234 RepID=UPI0023F61859|nr:sugar-binding transcriptional regulator [Lactobacillus sp. ESL0791]MDF7638090.1 sugar-binding transcriptional regulator [Lactobacillus sp. ESL0791]
MEKNLINQLISVAELYYLNGNTQKEIADKVHIHRSEISRMLKEARKLGLVKISINRPNNNLEGLQKFFIKRFGLKDALIIPENTDDLNLKTLGNFAANYLEKNIQSNFTIGISWGRTLAHTFQAMPSKSTRHGITVVPLIGGPTGILKNDYQSNHLVYTLGEKLNAKCETLNCPAIVSSEKIKNELTANPNNQVVFNYWKNLDCAIVGIGSSLITDLSQWKEFYKNSNFNNIFKKTNTVGDILSQPFTAEGKIINSSQYHVIGMNLAEVKKVPQVIGIACGKNKIKSILGALNTGVLDVLITTDITALGVKDLCN